MSRRLTLALCATLWLSSHVVLLGEEIAPPAQQAKIHFKVYDGDPNGSVKKGTLKVSSPAIITPLGQTGTIAIGEELEQRNPDGERYFDGLRISVKPTMGKDGKILVEVDYRYSKLEFDGKRVVNDRARNLRTSVGVRDGMTLPLVGSQADLHDANGKITTSVHVVEMTCELLPMEKVQR